MRLRHLPKVLPAGALAFSACLSIVVAGCGSSPTPAAKEAAAPAPSRPGFTDNKLPSFAQEITTTVKRLTLKPGETTKIPVTVRNTGSETWSSYGKDPITFSYRWYLGSKEDTVLPTNRTLLPQPLMPGQSAMLDATVVAPPVPGAWTMRLSMVQEGVAWFITEGGHATDVAVDVK